MENKNEWIERGHVNVRADTYREMTEERFPHLKSVPELQKQCEYFKRNIAEREDPENLESEVLCRVDCPYGNQIEKGEEFLCATRGLVTITLNETEALKKTPVISVPRNKIATIFGRVIERLPSSLAIYLTGRFEKR